MPQVKAPRGGVQINNHLYRAGQWIPAAALANATPAQKSALQRKLPQSQGVMSRVGVHKADHSSDRLEHLRKVHDALSKKWGDQTKHRLAADAESLLKAHGGAKDEGHKKTLSHHLGGTHAMLGMAGADDEGEEKPKGTPSTPAGGPTEAAVQGTSIKVAKGEGGFTATAGEAKSAGASAEEAVGKLVLENGKTLGITVEMPE